MESNVYSVKYEVTFQIYLDEPQSTKGKAINTDPRSKRRLCAQVPLHESADVAWK
jgi:hypothetical protein